jgi:hypothetical protein
MKTPLSARPHGINGKNLMGLQDFERNVNLNFFRCAKLHDARGILVGIGKQVRHVTFLLIGDIDYNTLLEFIDQTIYDKSSNSALPDRIGSEMLLCPLK